ncbi:MAG: hypothetical protein EYC62_01355 [Alphaproteobacteria bacterium]|nr:MAG: hypothetical protein EYC62_01355 [Alphaproteobacteria bacterium]
MAFRVGDYSKFTSINLLIQNSQARVSALQIQAATGRKGETYSDIASSANQALSLENSYMRIKRYQDNITIADRKIDEFDASMTSIQGIAEQFKTLLTGALNANNADLISLSTQAQSMLDSLQSTLNKQVDGQYLFAGSMTNTRPVDTTRWGAPMPIPTNFNAPNAYTVPTLPATPTTFPVTIGANATSEYFGYYMGNTATQTVRADDNLSVSIGTTASNPAFAQLIYALRLAATIGAAPTAEQHDRLEGASTIMTTVIGSLADTRATIGAQGRMLLDTKDTHGAYLGKIEDLVQDLQAADIPETMAKLSAEQTQLEASYMTISRLNQVSLVNFLR